MQNTEYDVMFPACIVSNMGSFSSLLLVCTALGGLFQKFSNESSLSNFLLKKETTVIVFYASISFKFIYNAAAWSMPHNLAV